MIPEEKFAMSKDKFANVITQVPEFFTCQLEVKLRDKRTGIIEDWDLFYQVPHGMSWKAEAERIVNSMGFETCGFGDHVLRSTFLNTYDLHVKAKDVKDF